MFKESSPSRTAILVSVCLGIVFAGSALIWLTLDRIPPNWDDAWYLSNSLTAYDALTQGGIAGYLAKLNTVFGFKAPLIAALPAPFYLIFGRRWQAAYLVNIAAMFGLFAMLYRIAARWWNPRAAAFAIAIAGSMPLLYGLARWYMVEYVLAAMLTAAIYVLIESDRMARARHNVVFGIICGFGLLLKILFPVYLLPCFLYTWIRSERRIRSLVLAGFPCLVVAFPWYASHLRPTVANALNAGYGATAINYGIGPILSLTTIGRYLSQVAANGVSWYFLCLAVLLILRVVFLPRGWRVTSGVKMGSGALLVAWALPFAIFLFGVNKDVRFVAPILPAVALWIAFLLDLALPQGVAGTAAGCLLLAFPIVQMFAVSFGVPYAAKGGGYVRRYNRQGWPHDEFLKLAAANIDLRYGERALLLTGVDRSGLNAENIELAAVRLGLPFAVETTAHDTNLEALRQRLGQARIFVVKQGGEPESPAHNPFAGELARSVAVDPRFREIPYARQLPDGGTLRIYQRLSAAQRTAEVAPHLDSPPRPDDFTIDFGGVLALTGASLTAGTDAYDARLRWRCTRPPGRDYLCFTHLIDRNNKIVGQLDHPLLDGDPPLRFWRTGDGGEEAIHLRLAPGAPLTELRLRFGIYDPKSGVRLPVGSLSRAASRRFSVVDDGTALLMPQGSNPSPEREKL